MDKKMFHPSYHNILIVDDDEVSANSSRMILEKEGYRVIVCSEIKEITTSIKNQNIHVALIDSSFLKTNIEEAMQMIRKTNQNIQVVLQIENNQSAQIKDLIGKLDIQLYHNKNDGPDRMLMCIEVAAKFYHHLDILERGKEGLRYILKITPQIYKIQSLQDLLKGTLLQLIGLLNGENGFLITLNLETFSMRSGVNLFEYSVGVGRFLDKNCLSLLNKDEKGLVDEVTKHHKMKTKDNIIAVPVVLRDKLLGLIYIETEKDYKDDVELLQIFANQIAIAIENTILYELATIDSLTKLYVKGYFIQRLREELRSSYRYRYPLVILFIDIDYFKKVNDTYGHQFGDFILAEVAQIVKNSIRETDIACRYGGDEFAIILPHTLQQGGNILAERIRKKVNDKEFISPAGEKVQTSISIGLSCMIFEENSETKIIRSNDFFETTTFKFIENVDKALYMAKNTGRNRICEIDPVMVEESK